VVPTRRAIERAVAGSGFGPEIVEKVARLGAVLAAIAESDVLRGTLVLKGGTALNLFCGRRPMRLSVDIDLNYIATSDRREMLANRPVIEKSIERMLQPVGYSVRRSRDAFAGRKLFVGYRRIVDRRPDTLQIDLNFLERTPLRPPRMLAMWQLMDQPAVTFPVLHFDELAAGKIRAYLDRGAARDIWDVAHLPVLSNGAWPAPESRPVLVALCGTLPHALTTYRERGAPQIDARGFGDHLLPLMPAAAEWAIEGLAERAWAVVSPFLDLTAAEQRFSERLQQGRLEPELLVPDDPELCRSIADAPPLRWKALNAHRHWNERA